MCIEVRYGLFLSSSGNIPTKHVSSYCKGEPGIVASGPEEQCSKGRNDLEKDRGDETKVNIHLFHHRQNHYFGIKLVVDISLD